MVQERKIYSGFSLSLRVSRYQLRPQLSNQTPPHKCGCTGLNQESNTAAKESNRKGFGVHIGVEKHPVRQSQCRGAESELASLQAAERALLEASKPYVPPQEQNSTAHNAHSLEADIKEELGIADDTLSSEKFKDEENTGGFGKGLKSVADCHLVPLPMAPDLEGKSVRSRWNPIHLAFLGDAVWELFMRNQYFNPPRRLTDYSELVKGQVNAEAQALFYEALQAGPLLTEEEREVLKWGLNAKVVAPKRFKASGMHILTYKKATALECLVGFLYVTDSARLQRLVQYLLTL